MWNRQKLIEKKESKKHMQSMQKRATTEVGEVWGLHKLKVQCNKKQGRYPGNSNGSNWDPSEQTFPQCLACAQQPCYLSHETCECRCKGCRERSLWVTEVPSPRIYASSPPTKQDIAFYQLSLASAPTTGTEILSINMSRQPRVTQYKRKKLYSHSANSHRRIST